MRTLVEQVIFRHNYFIFVLIKIKETPMKKENFIFVLKVLIL